jgi:hypothetical protein
MAIFYPSYSDEELEKLRRADGGKHSAEVRFYKACQTLENNVLVIHSRGFAQPDQKGKLAYGEIDFILAFANAGLMLVEVKGGRISLDDKGQWFTTNKEDVTKPLKRSPVVQVHEQRFHLQKIIESDPKWKDWGRGPVIYAPAVFFPNMKISQKEKFESAAKGQVSFGFLEDLARLKSWTKDVNSHWHESVRNPADGELFLGKHGLELVLAILCPVITVPPEAARFSDLHVPKEEEPPTEPSQPAGITESPTKSWEELVRHVCQNPESPPFVIKKRDGAITLTREWNPQLSAYIWTKESKGSFDFLSNWEEQLLKRIAEADVKKRVRWIDMLSVSSPLHMGDLPREEQPRGQSKVRTYDAGPTLDVWQCMRPRVEGRPLKHPFVTQQSYLRLVRGILIALEDFHEKGFVHCDLHQGNIALPVRGSITPQISGIRGEHIVLEPIWDDIRVIDLDFSASDRIAPPIRLPHDLAKFPRGTSRMSDHLRHRLSAIDAWLANSGNADRCYDPTFWSQSGNREHLDCLQDLDWREDLYQLGYLLREIRDTWGGARHVVTMAMGKLKDVNTFIEVLPEEMMAWGNSKQIAWNPNSITNEVKAPRPLPHGDYISRIDYLLKQLSELPRAIVLYRQDHDPAYDPATTPQEQKDAGGIEKDSTTANENETPVNPQLAIFAEMLTTYPERERPTPKRRNLKTFARPALIGIGLLLVVGGWLTVARSPELSIDEWRRSDAFMRCDSYAESSIRSGKQSGPQESRFAANACAEFLQNRNVPAVLRFEALMTRSIANKNANALLDALEDLRLAEELDPKNYWVDINRSVVLSRLSRENEAFASLEAALRKGWRNQGPKIEQLSDFDALTRSPRYSEIKRRFASAI